jgi:hypothetical protein
MRSRQHFRLPRGGGERLAAKTSSVTPPSNRRISRQCTLVAFRCATYRRALVSNDRSTVGESVRNANFDAIGCGYDFTLTYRYRYCGTGGKPGRRGNDQRNDPIRSGQFLSSHDRCSVRRYYRRRLGHRLGIQYVDAIGGGRRFSDRHIRKYCRHRATACRIDRFRFPECVFGEF